MTKWLKHVADLDRIEKQIYLHRFPERLLKISSMLSYIRFFSSIEQCNNFIMRVNPITVLVDNKLNPHIVYPRKIIEDRVKEAHRKKLMLLADNIAYYAYWACRKLRKPGKLKIILK